MVRLRLLRTLSFEILEHIRISAGGATLTFKDFEDFTQLRVNLDGKPIGGGIERGALTPAGARKS